MHFNLIKAFTRRVKMIWLKLIFDIESQALQDFFWGENHQYQISKKINECIKSAIVWFRVQIKFKKNVCVVFRLHGHPKEFRCVYKFNWKQKSVHKNNCKTFC